MHKAKSCRFVSSDDLVVHGAVSLIIRFLAACERRLKEQIKMVGDGMLGRVSGACKTGKFEFAVEWVGSLFTLRAKLF
jgi:hypothetical protein